MLAPGRHVRRHVGRFSARPGDLRHRIFPPRGRALHACRACGAAHVTRAIACARLACALRNALTGLGLTDQEAAAVATTATITVQKQESV